MSEARVTNLSNESNSGGPTISGITTFSGANYFVPPVGNTAERPENAEPGSIRFNIDSKHLEYFKGDTLGWEQIVRRTPNLGGGSASFAGTGTRAIFAGGNTPSAQPNSCFNNVDALTIPTLGNTIDFNNLTGSYSGGNTVSDATRAVYAGGMEPLASSSPTDLIQYCTFSTQNDYVDSGGDLSTSQSFGANLSDKTRGIIAGRGSPGYNAAVDYINIQSLGLGANDFGDLHTAKGYSAGMSSSTRGIIAGGFHYPAGAYNTIEYITVQTVGSFVDFGDCSVTRYECAGFSNATRGIIAAGYGPAYTNMIEYITIATTGHVADFGDLTAMNGTGKYGTCSSTRGIVAGGYIAPATPYANTIEYLTIATTGNGTDFGDFQGFGRRSGAQNGVSNGHGGL